MNLCTLSVACAAACAKCGVRVSASPRPRAPPDEAAVPHSPHEAAVAPPPHAHAPSATRLSPTRAPFSVDHAARWRVPPGKWCLLTQVSVGADDIVDGAVAAPGRRVGQDARREQDGDEAHAGWDSAGVDRVARGVVRSRC